MYCFWRAYLIYDTIGLSCAQRNDDSFSPHSLLLLKQQTVLTDWIHTIVRILSYLYRYIHARFNPCDTMNNHGCTVHNTKRLFLYIRSVCRAMHGIGILYVANAWQNSLFFWWNHKRMSQQYFVILWRLI